MVVLEEKVQAMVEPVVDGWGWITWYIHYSYDFGHQNFIC